MFSMSTPDINFRILLSFSWCVCVCALVLACVCTSACVCEFAQAISSIKPHSTRVTGIKSVHYLFDYYVCVSTATVEGDYS